MKNVENSVKSSFEERVEMMKFTPMLKPVNLTGFRLRDIITDLVGYDVDESGNRKTESLYWAPSDKDVELTFGNQVSYEKVRRLVTTIADEKEMVFFQQPYDDNYITLSETGRYIVELDGYTIQFNLVLVEKIS